MTYHVDRDENLAVVALAFTRSSPGDLYGALRSWGRKRRARHLADKRLRPKTIANRNASLSQQNAASPTGLKCFRKRNCSGPTGTVSCSSHPPKAELPTSIPTFCICGVGRLVTIPPTALDHGVRQCCAWTTTPTIPWSNNAPTAFRPIGSIHSSPAAMFRSRHWMDRRRAAAPGHSRAHREMKLSGHGPSSDRGGHQCCVMTW